VTKRRVGRLFKDYGRTAAMKIEYWVSLDQHKFDALVEHVCGTHQRTSLRGAKHRREEKRSTGANWTARL
jgi:hypothetical protein